MPLSEADTRSKLIDPALHARDRPEGLIRREVQITNGRLFLVGSETHRRQPTFADYVLGPPSLPLAVLEAKDESHAPAAGLQQAKAYAEKLDVSFAYSSNGKAFVEFDFTTNLERDIALEEFPTPGVLHDRLSAATGGTVFGDPARIPYHTGTGVYPRYYQDVAVRRTLAAVEGGATRLLLALATGTGKTYIASQIAWKLYAAKRARRTLFLAVPLRCFRMPPQTPGPSIRRWSRQS